MEIIGVLGGVASGKSAVAKMFEQLGAMRLDADRVGHDVLEETDVVASSLNRWGEQIRDPQGGLDRRAIARLVFAPTPQAEEELRFLERLTHPHITEQLKRDIATAAEQGYGAVVLDAAVMIKAGWDRLCNRMVFVDVPRVERERRARQRGWTAAQFAAREASQLPLALKRQRAQIVIDNSGTLEETFDQVRTVWSTWQAAYDNGRRA